ncbi:phosphoenolpyruvate--protein phosphotransferase [Haloplasma contractile]|uniref:Phosphoenolpyruvate-protein phosphotransferase n=1 Tax=Haloplasma contractile SSD-17B TaxID=1033810 RepID=F7PV34_9MOLU|nr:phosphoenolpyruvate--protein phosphotransferase [Haloplasma contractile]ERJ11268.1 phosphotransferase system enzyme I PtsI protein [Haloplasma contractile SSD-17B]
MIKGIVASNGIAIAPAYKLEEIKLDITKQVISNPEEECARFSAAIEEASNQLEIIRQQAFETMGEEQAKIFEAHLLVVKDPELIEPVKSKVMEEKVNAEFAVKEIRDQFVMIFENMDNEYMKERASDIRDVTNRLLSILMNVKSNDPSLISEESILIANDLTPSDTAGINPEIVKGFITNIGGRTSHSAIMARSLELPAVVGTKTVMESIQDGDLIILDALNGEVIINPTDEQIVHYKDLKANYEQEQEELKVLKDQPTLTNDDYHVELAANIGTPNDLKGVISHGAEGIGLFRTEFLYMNRSDFPTEEEQFKAYQKVLKGMNGKPVVIRTLDIGGDKELPYLKMPKELNPFLGYRAIRLCLDRREIFKTQLRALLRASTYGSLRIMFPMIATIQEFKDAKTLLNDVKQELLDEGIQVSDRIQIGMMVEIPSAALLADQFAKIVDFFSIGTNDLIQYTFAADRMNEHVSYLYQPLNPSLLRLIKLVIDAAHKEGKWVGMCGEMAGDELAVPVLLGLGLDEFSMSATSILKTRKLIKKLNMKDMNKLANKAADQSTTDEVVNLVNDSIK